MARSTDLHASANIGLMGDISCTAALDCVASNKKTNHYYFKVDTLYLSWFNLCRLHSWFDNTIANRWTVLGHHFLQTLARLIRRVGVLVESGQDVFGARIDADVVLDESDNLIEGI